jgi:hypothetical protein
MTALAISTCPLGAGADDQERADGRGRSCTDSTIKGTYGIQFLGTRPAPRNAPAGTIETVIGIVVRTYDGRGQFYQVDNVKGSISQNDPSDREGWGTYEVAADCSGITRFDPGSGVLLVERMVIVDRGREIRTATMSPPALMVTGVQQRIQAP